MSFRILQYSLDDVAVDYETVAASINRTARRQGARVSGMCQTDHQLILNLLGNDGPAEYVIAPFSGFAAADIVADLNSRWQGGFVTRGLIRLPELYLGLFERLPPAPNTA